MGYKKRIRPMNVFLEHVMLWINAILVFKEKGK